MELAGEINPIIAERFTDHLDVFGQTMEQMETIQLIAERCKTALAAGNKVFFVVMAALLLMRNIWQRN